MDGSRFRKKVLLDLVTHALVLVPGVFGLSCLVLSWALARGVGMLSFLGVAGLLASVGALASRWILKSDDIIKKTFEDLQAEALREQDKALDELDRKLRKDRDSRTQASLRELREIYEEFKHQGAWASNLGAKQAFDLANKVEELFRGSIRALERSLELWEASRRMRTKESKQRVLRRRDEIVEDVQESVHQLAHTIDGVQTLALGGQRTSEDLSRVRAELDESLAVARRVEERMQSIDLELEGSGEMEDGDRRVSDSDA